MASLPIAPRQLTTSPGVDVDDPESFCRGNPGGVEPLVAQPAGEGVCAEVLPDDEVRDSLVGQPRQPGRQHLVQDRLADADRRVGPDLVEAQVRIDVLGTAGVDTVADPEGLGVAIGEVDGEVVDVHGDDL